MNRPARADGLVCLSESGLETLLDRAAARGIRHALKDIGLDNGEACENARGLRSLLQALRLTRRTAWQIAVHVLTTVFLTALLAFAGIKLKPFGDLQ